MSQCARTIEWPGVGTYVFDLSHARVMDVLSGTRSRHVARTRTGVVQLLPLHGQFGDTPAACLKRFEEGVYSVDDIERILLYGLWGGGMGFAAAHELIEQHVKGKPLARNAMVAFAVIGTLFTGNEAIGAA